MLLHSSVSLYPIPPLRHFDWADVYQGDTCPLFLLPYVSSYFLECTVHFPSHFLLIICAPSSLLSTIQMDYNPLSSSVRLPFFSSLAQLPIALLSSSNSFRGLDPVSYGMSARRRVTLLICITWTPDLEGIVVDTLNGLFEAYVDVVR